MSKYSSSVHRREPKVSSDPHPIWNTLGCIMMIIVPIMSIAAAIMTIEWGLSGGWPVPVALLQPIILPDWIYALRGLASILTRIFSIDYLVGYAFFSLIYIVLLGGIVAFLYALVYRMAGPPKYGPLDAGPVKSRTYKR